MPRNDDVSEKQAMIAELQHVSLAYLAQLNKAGRRACTPLGLTYGQAMLLIFVERGKNRLNELCDLLNVVRPALSALTTHLAEAGLVERQGHDDDARRVVIKLTAKGMETCHALRQAWQANFPIDLQRFSDDELRQLVGAVHIITRYTSD